MKIFSTIAATSLVIGAVTSSEHTERKLILGGKPVAAGTKTYVAGIRSTANGDTFCGGSLISPTHVLTSVLCTSGHPPNFVSVGSHYINGTQDGEQIKVIKAQNHTEYNSTDAYNDFAILTLEKPSKFTPINLPKADDSDIIPGMWTKAMGWGQTTYPNGTYSNTLQNVGVEVWDNEDCSELFIIDNSTVCAGGAAGRDSCNGDNGGPLVKEKGLGDADDVLIGLSSWGSGCGKDGNPSMYSRVSYALKWINSVTKA
ncbi:Serine protease trypsin-like protein [Phytophthora megakarya]|uniref:Serine protease trypsin-like protein n=1 Tax=Phytophthora megakarya TaxID=4795 RepID=A0A225V4M3_9STRA|nr:Serine protease trypsin-like protein [Phytophthora megakarya]